MKNGDEKIALMYQEYGRFTGCRCRSCPHLDVFTNGDNTRIWYKCRMYGLSSGPGTDWRCGNEACGAFTIDPQEAQRRKLYGEVYRKCKGLRKKKPAQQIRGQTAMNL